MIIFLSPSWPGSLANQMLESWTEKLLLSHARDLIKAEDCARVSTSLLTQGAPTLCWTKPCTYKRCYVGCTLFLLWESQPSAGLLGSFVNSCARQSYTDTGFCCHCLKFIFPSVCTSPTLGAEEIRPSRILSLRECTSPTQSYLQRKARMYLPFIIPNAYNSV